MAAFGNIRSYNSARGTGTIDPEDGGDAIPFRKADMQQQSQEPQRDDRFGYDTETGDNGLRRAVNMQLQQEEQGEIQKEQAEQQPG